MDGYIIYYCSYTQFVEFHILQIVSVVWQKLKSLEANCGLEALYDIV